MDRKTVIAFVLIGFLLIMTQSNWYKEKVLGIKPVKEQDKGQVVSDTSTTSSTDERVVVKEMEDKKEPAPKIDVAYEKEEESISSIYESLDSAGSRDVVVRTDLFTATISGVGATISSWILNDYFYDKENGVNVQMINEDAYGNLGISFLSNEDTLKTHKLPFIPDKSSINLENGRQNESVVFELKLADNKKVRKIYTFYKDEYAFDLKVELINMYDIISEHKYTLEWLSGLKYTEKNIKEDIRNSIAYVFTEGGDKESLKLPEKPNVSKQLDPIEGEIAWVGVRTKYFASIVLPGTGDNDLTARVTGVTRPYDGKNVQKIYSTKLGMRISDTDRYKKDFKVYIGPMDYDIIKQYHSGFDKIMGYGPAIIRPFAKLTLRAFKFLHSFIPNYGVVLIIFAILVKLIVFPLTRKSYTSMREMQKIQPMITELKEKYSKDPQRLNKETMKLYKEHGVNPLSGCLPMLLQMPLLWSVFLVFRNTIQLRQASFMLWINDLSSPDTITNLPFSLPMLGSELHVIPLIMGVTMLFQQKMTMTDPKQKAMLYFMPLFLTVLFYNFPSGLNIYYTLFNIFTIVQQRITPDRKVEEFSQPQKSIGKTGKSQKLKRK